MAVFVFLFYLAAGLLFSLAMVRLGEEGRTFLLFNGALALALGATALTLRAVGPTRLGFGTGVALSPLTLAFGGLALGLLSLYLVVGARGHDRRGALRAAALAALVAVASDAASLHAQSATLRHVLNAVTSAWFAGAILLAMVLGHFYLVIPRLSIAPLRALFLFSLAALIARIVLVGLTGALWWSNDGSHAITIGSFLNRGVFVMQRLLFGLVIPASLAWITWKTIEMRSTQSATGILYVVVFLTLVGEALSVYLSLETSLPL